MVTCETCRGEGFIVDCLDDICNGLGRCSHGDGEAICPECRGEGEIDEDIEDRDGQG